MEKDALEIALAKIVVDSISKEMQSEIFVKAIQEFLFTHRHNGEPMLTSTFQSALRNATSTIAEKVLEEPEIKEKVRQTFRVAVEEALTSGDLHRMLVERISHSIRYR